MGMKMGVRGLLLVVYISTFLLQLPVTTFPATDGHDGTRDPVLADTIRVADSRVVADNPKSSVVSGIFASDNIYKDVNGAEYSKSSATLKKHDSTEDFINVNPVQSVSLNGRTNQASPEDLHDFNRRKNLKGLERVFSTNQINSAINPAVNEINRLKYDLEKVGIRLENLQQKRVNKSINLSSSANVLSQNKSYKNSDSFDVKKAVKSAISLKSTNKQSLTINGSSNGGDSRLKDSRRLVEYTDGIFWSTKLLSQCPSGFSKTDYQIWREKLNSLRVIKVESGCGSLQNRLITLNDSSKACVRYRLNNDQMQGEVYSYYLGQLMGLGYIPPSTILTLDNGEQWERVREDVLAVKWSANRPLIVTKWLESLEPVFMPNKLKDPQGKLNERNYQFHDLSLKEACELVQWSDLIVFDYISANLDRVVNNMFNMQWNPNMLAKPIHNLEKTTQSGQYMFIDNESGLFHGYRLTDTYDSYHEKLLSSICTFKQSTIETLQKLLISGSIGNRLQSLYENNEQYSYLLPKMPQKNKKILEARVERLLKHIQMCKHKFVTS